MLPNNTYFDDSHSVPDHASLDSGRFVGDFDRLHVEEDRMLLVGFGLRQQRMKQDATSRVDQERVGELLEPKVDDRTEQRVHRYVDARDALEFAVHEHRQAAGRYHS